MKFIILRKAIGLIIALVMILCTSFTFGLISNAYIPEIPTAVSGLWINGETYSFSFSGIAINIGYSESYVLKAFGNPDRKDPSEYGFTWYIYRFNNTKYIQIGIQNSKVVALFSNYRNFGCYRYPQTSGQTYQHITIGTAKSTVKDYLGDPVQFIQKGGKLYQPLCAGTSGIDCFLYNNSYLMVFYDIYNNYEVTAMQVIDKSVEEAYQSNFPIASTELSRSFELQIFDITNAIRIRYGKKPFIWSETATLVARAHSVDMAERNFLDHINPDGIGPVGRLTNAGIQAYAIAENCNWSNRNAMYCVQSWMSSIDHRNTILGGPWSYLGVGAYMGGSERIYYTQLFYDPV